MRLDVSGLSLNSVEKGIEYAHSTDRINGFSVVGGRVILEVE